MPSVQRLLAGVAMAGALAWGAASPAAAENVLRWGAHKDIVSLDPYGSLSFEALLRETVETDFAPLYGEILPIPSIPVATLIDGDAVPVISAGSQSPMVATTARATPPPAAGAPAPIRPRVRGSWLSGQCHVSCLADPAVLPSATPILARTIVKAW